MNTRTARALTALIFNIIMRNRSQIKEVNVTGSRHSQVGKVKVFKVKNEKFSKVPLFL